mmetsp:Transcript_27594/g.58960  ORF Transcript_27594/g.58960 Transcript_27594/m.58960 type:complete len:488 (+) Transcript_27594:105-1568(+)
MESSNPGKTARPLGGPLRVCSLSSLRLRHFRALLAPILLLGVVMYTKYSSGNGFSSEIQSNRTKLPPHVLALDGTSIDVGQGVFGTIQDERLVVNVNRTFASWGEPQVRLCELLQKMTQSDELGKQQQQQPANRTQQATQTLLLPFQPLLNLTINCTELLLPHNLGIGQGNWITIIYNVRMAVALARVDFQFQCDVKASENPDAMLPHFAGFYPAPGLIGADNEWPYSDSKPTEQEACWDQRVRRAYGRLRIDKVAGMIRDNAQKIAVTIAGSFNGKYQHPAIPPDQKPLRPDIVLDDVAIHLRCGDIFGAVNRYDFGFIPFSAYKKYIRRDGSIKRIGILTQPFEKSRNRAGDNRKTEECKTLTYLLVDYLKDFMAPHSGNVTITIHNSPNETLPMVYARLSMANQSFTSLSSFGIFPVIGAFGEGYFQKGNGGVNPFAQYVPSYRDFHNIHMMTAPVLPAGRIRHMPLNETFHWFVHQELESENT